MSSNKEVTRSILQNDISGHQVTVSDHSDPNLIGITGVILSETRNMVEMNIEGKSCMISKVNGSFTFSSGERLVTISGKLLIGTHAKRGKKKLRGW
ncbi:MAG: ribonuclease P protein subunit [Candidatus Kariarchaeaceae archaeon]|jgi:RNase P/RNase MRP subunit p29